MKLRPRRRTVVLVLSWMLVMLPLQQVLAANPNLAADPQGMAASAVTVRDVALHAGGILQGQVVDPQGHPCPALAVAIAKLGTTPATPASARTDAEGKFQFTGLTAGVYRVETAAGGSICRLWAPNTAPPAAAPAALVVQGQGLARGNLGGIGWLGWTLIGLGVAAAIAIPLILDDDDDAS